MKVYVLCEWIEAEPEAELLVTGVTTSLEKAKRWDAVPGCFYKEFDLEGEANG